MRKVVYFVASSLDGFIARKDGRVDWLFSDGDYGYARFYASVDTVIAGRKTYEQALAFGDTFPGKKCCVLSRTMKRPKSDNAEIVSGPLRRLITRLRKKRGKDIWLAGGGAVAGQALDGGLIDRLIVSIHPVALGSGIPLFAGARRGRVFTLHRTKSFPSGLLQVEYRKAPRAASAHIS